MSYFSKVRLQGWDLNGGILGTGAWVDITGPEHGGQGELWTADKVVRNLLEELLGEAKLIRTHLSMMTGEELKEGDERE